MNTELDLARRALSGGAGVRSHSLRTACWLSRLALERAVGDLLEAKGVSAPRATMASRLSALEVLYREDDPTVAQRAEYAWSRLSNASHYHAFELTPSVAEVRGLVDMVSQLELEGSDGARRGNAETSPDAA